MIETYTSRIYPNFKEDLQEPLFKSAQAGDKTARKTPYEQITTSFSKSLEHTMTKKTDSNTKITSREENIAVKLNLGLRALQNKAYPTLDVGDEVNQSENETIEQG